LMFSSKVKNLFHVDLVERSPPAHYLCFRYRPFLSSVSLFSAMEDHCFSTLTTGNYEEPMTRSSKDTNNTRFRMQKR
jgi:hypothetical protein